MFVDQIQPGDFATAETESQYRQQLEQLNERVKQVEEKLMDLQVERQAGPIEKAMAARSQGAPGLAIGELEEANRGNMSPMVVRPQLLDLYCQTGQPDRAYELMSMTASEDPNLGTEPGTSFMRQGEVYFLMGNYATAASLWQERAIPRVRYDRTLRALTLGQLLTRGELTQTVNINLVLPTLLNRQAFWEFDLALCHLESGAPDKAAEYFTHALKIVPDLGLRPLIAYYLEKLGKPVPALPKSKAESAGGRPAGRIESLMPGIVPEPAVTAPATTPPTKPGPDAPAESKKKP